MAFTEEDVKFLDDFGAFLFQKSELKALTFADAIQFNRHLVSYNQLRNKVNEHILEVVKVHVAPQPEAKPSKRGK